MQENRIVETPPSYLYRVCLTNGPLRKISISLFRAILHKFFFLQFQTYWRWKKRKIVSVDHPLDEFIPFKPDGMGLYLSFIPLWQKTVGFYRKQFGPSANGAVENFLQGLGNLYRRAGDVYDRCQSTTTRPGPRWNFTSLIIHFLDPHLHCVPSLHVMVVCYNAEWLKRMVETQTSDPQGYIEEIRYVQRQAAKIIDAILTVKQHSSNCVAAGLYFLNSLYPEYSREACKTVVENLLASSPETSRREEIRAYLRRLLCWFFSTHDETENPDPGEIVLKFLAEYESGHFSAWTPADE